MAHVYGYVDKSHDEDHRYKRKDSNHPDEAKRLDAKTNERYAGDHEVRYRQSK